MGKFPTHYCGIDPSQRRSAIGWLGRASPIAAAVLHVVGPVESIGSFEPLASLAADPLVTVHFLIECPTWPGVGTKEVRAAGVAWERQIRKLFPRRHAITRLDPREWQKALLPHVPGMSTKERSLWYADKALGLGAEIGSDSDLADAACILEYLRRVVAIS